jgi:H+/Cl- antiporter ClcA
MGLTAIAVGVGFRGGEVTPLFFIGALLGNLLSIILPLELVTLVAMGMLFIFGRCTLTPLATCFLAYELFGIQMAILILPFIFLSSFLFKKYTLYQ